MEDNLMKYLYKHFGEEKEEGQAMMSISNVFHEMGKEDEGEKTRENKDNSKSFLL